MYILVRFLGLLASELVHHGSRNRYIRLQTETQKEASIPHAIDNLESKYGNVWQPFTSDLVKFSCFP